MSVFFNRIEKQKKKNQKKNEIELFAERKVFLVSVLLTKGVQTRQFAIDEDICNESADDGFIFRILFSENVCK